MIPTALPPLPLPDVPLDVIEFASEHDALFHIRPLLTVTRRLFPDAPIKLRLERDMEVADDARVPIEVEIPESEAGDYLEQYNRWVGELAKLGFPDRSWIFRRRLTPVAR